jgi:hypothetical protein
VLLLAVLLGVRPSCLFGVMSSVGGVPVRGVRMVGGLLMVPGVVVFASFCVVVGSMCGVFCCLLVMFRSLFGHGVFPLLVLLPVGRPYSLGKQRNSRISEAFLYDLARCSLAANHFVEGNKRSKDECHNAKEGDTKINALHAVDLVLPDNLSVSGRFGSNCGTGQLFRSQSGRPFGRR